MDKLRTAVEHINDVRINGRRQSLSIQELYNGNPRFGWDSNKSQSFSLAAPTPDCNIKNLREITRQLRTGEYAVDGDVTGSQTYQCP
jgi:hypothetical protein